MKRPALVLAILIGCNGSQPAPPKPEPTTAAKPVAAAGPSEHADEQQHEELPTKVRLSPKVIAATGIKSALVAAEALPQTVSLTGQLISDPDRTAKIAARVAGRIVDVGPKEGDRVKSGALLAVIESPELARARATLTVAQAKARTAKQNLERLERVADKGLASGQEVSSAEAEAQTRDAEARAARQTLAAFGVGVESGDGARMEVRTPVAGFVLARDAIRGQTVTPEHVLFTVADLDKAFFTARLFEKDLARVKTGSLADVRLNAYPNELFAGRVENVGRALDQQQRTVVARIAIDNRDDLLKVGLFGTALVVVEDATPRTPRPVVPQSAITKIADHDCVFVQEPDGDFEVHRVTLGRAAAAKVEVVAGLRTDERVVTSGVFTLKSAVLKGSFGEEE